MSATAIGRTHPWSWWGDARDRFLASDPGLARLRMATRASVAVASSLAVEWVFATVTGQSALVCMLMGTVVAMMASMALTDPTVRGKAVTAVFIPVAVATGILPGTAAESHRELTLVVFVAVMFAAVFVRRFGLRFFFYGFLAWMGYFFSVFLKAGWALLPTLVGAVVVATAWVFLLSTTVLRDRPELTLRRTLDAFWARGRQVADAATEVLDRPTSHRPRRRLHRALVRVAEAALLIDGQLGVIDSGPGGRSQGAVRGWVVDAELAFDAVATATAHLADRSGELDEPTRTTVSRLLHSVGDGDLARADALAARLPEGAGPSSRELTGALRDLARLRGSWVELPERHRTSGPDEDFEPAVTLFAGNLPGTASVAGTMLDDRDLHRFNPLRRLDLTSRQAVQVAIATSLAIIAGTAVDQRRYYWAVIAAFVAFTGTSTVAETARKAAGRLGGTLVGLVVSIVLAEATAGHTGTALCLVVASIFLGFYLQRLSYAAMIFFITIMIGQLYSMLHTFTSGLMVLRLEETAVGGLIGVAVSLLVLPTSTRATARTASATLLGQMADLLQGIGGRLRDGAPGEGALDGQAREMDAALRQYLNAMRPLTWSAMLRSENGPLRYRGMLLTRAVNDLKHLMRLASTAPPDPALAAALEPLADMVRCLEDAGPRIRAADVVEHGRAAQSALQALGPSTLHDRLNHLYGVLVRLAGPVPHVDLPAPVPDRTPARS